MTDLKGKSLKELHYELIDNWNEHHRHRKYTVPEWYKVYCKIYNQVAEIRLLLNDGYKLDSQRDREFLEKLICSQHSGVSDGGIAQVGDENFKILISNPDFLNALEVLIKIPNADNFEAFGDTWRQCKKAGKNDNPLRVNRVVAACTNQVSSTVSKDIFNDIFKKLIERSYITPYTQPDAHYPTLERGWFNKNQHLMRELRKNFQAELVNGKTDSILLSIFVWELHWHLDKWY